MKHVRKLLSLVMVFGILAGALGVFILPVGANTSSAANVAKISYKMRITPGQNNHTIAYWWATSGSKAVNSKFQNRILAAREKIMYPGGGMTNPIILWRTTNNNDSKMDFYQMNLGDDIPAIATSWRRPTPTSQYQRMQLSDKDKFNWVYGEITLNHKFVEKHDPSDTLLEAIIIHEMMHVYGAKNIYDNRKSIMHGHPDQWQNVKGLTADANQLLRNKYS